VIVVLGRPELDERGTLSGRAGGIAAAAAGAGAGVEIVGSVTDDGNGDATITALGRQRIGHAAVLRMPSAAEPQLEAADVELALRYLTECRVLVIADSLDEATLAAAIDGTRYHQAALVVAATQPQLPDDAAIPEHSTVLDAPDEDDGAFAGLVGRYAAQLDAGRESADAWRDALEATGWEAAAVEDEAGVGAES
jgi:hypothetical protein